jgi:hypothetical protein
MSAGKSILLLIYILTITGVNIRLHYCCGELADIHWGIKTNHFEDCKENNCCKSQKSCCRFEDIVIANSEDHNLPQSTHSETKGNIAIGSLNYERKLTLHHTDQDLLTAWEPPPVSKSKVYILFCQQRSYDDLI